MTTAPYPGFFRRKLQQLGFLLLLLQGPLLQGQAVTQPALYQVRFSLELRTRFAAVGLNAADTSLQGTVEGLMWMQPCAGRRVYCRFQRSAAVSLPMGPAASAEVQAVLETGFAFRQLPGGQVDSLYFSGPVPDAAIQVVQQLLEGWLLAPPTAADETVVLLSDGNAAAAYGMTHYNGDTASRQLVSLEEQAVFRLPTILHRHTVYRSTLTWKRTGPDNRMASVHGQLERTSKMNHRTLSVLTCSYDYTLLPKARLKGRPADACRSLSNETALPFYQPAKLQQLQEQRDRERAAAFSTATLLRLLNGLREDTPDATTEQLAELVRIAYVAEKDSLNQLTLLFTETAPESRRFKVLRSGIVAAATPAAQEALLACIRHYRRTDPQRLGFVLASAGLVAAPVPELLTTLYDLALNVSLPEGVRSSAALAVGNLVFNYRHKDPLTASALLFRLAGTLQRNADPLLLLAVLGNSGLNGILHYVQPFLADTIATNRAMAFYSLRFTDISVTNALYQRALLEEREEEVLLNILQALQFRPIHRPSVEPVLALALQGSTESICRAALDLLYQWSFSRLALLDTIRRVANGSRYPAVRETAARLLREAEE